MAIIALALSSITLLLLPLVGRGTSGLLFHDRIGVIPIEGVITDTDALIKSLVKFRKDRRIKAIILRINSPGGAVAPAQEMYREVRRTLAQKPVIASLGNVAASGGYYVAAAATKIVASPGTITGSIGVLVELMRLQELSRKVGVEVEVLKSGPFKDLGSPFRELSPQDRALLQSLIDELKGQFVRAVAEGRDLPVAKVEGLADGRVFTAQTAKSLGLVDRLGNFEDAVGMAQEMAGLKGEPTLVYPEKKGLGLWDLLVRSWSGLVNWPQSTSSPLQYRWAGFVQALR